MCVGHAGLIVKLHVGPVVSLRVSFVRANDRSGMRVSTASRFFTRKFFWAIRFSVINKVTVTMTRRPSGSWTTMIPMRSPGHSSWTLTNEEKDAGQVASPATIQVKGPISVAVGVFSFLIPEASGTVCPMTLFGCFLYAFSFTKRHKVNFWHFLAHDVDDMGAGGVRLVIGLWAIGGHSCKL